MDKPSSFETIVYDAKLTSQVHRFTNVKPVYNTESEAYELFFYDQAKLPSTKNIILIRAEDGPLQKDAEYYLLQGKERAGLYNLHFMPPFGPVTAFGMFLITAIKKQYS